MADDGQQALRVLSHLGISTDEVPCVSVIVVPGSSPAGAPTGGAGKRGAGGGNSTQAAQGRVVGADPSLLSQTNHFHQLLARAHASGPPLERHTFLLHGLSPHQISQRLDAQLTAAARRAGVKLVRTQDLGVPAATVAADGATSATHHDPTTSHVMHSAQHADGDPVAMPGNVAAAVAAPAQSAEDLEDAWGV